MERFASRKFLSAAALFATALKQPGVSPNVRMVAATVVAVVYIVAEAFVDGRAVPRREG